MNAGHIDCDVNGKAVAAVSDKALDRVCREAGVRPPTDFASQDPDDLRAFVEELGADPPPGGFPPEQWFDAGDGVRTFQALLAKADTLANRRVAAAQLIDEFERFIEVLTALQKRGIRWHLSLDI